MPMLKALVFDFDGMVVDTETPLIDAYGDVYALHGKLFERTEFLHSVGHADYSFDPWRAFGPGADLEALETVRRKFKMERTLAQPILPGVKALVEEAAAAGIKLAMASNSSHEWVEGHMRRLDLHRHFQFFACRGDTPAPKPEPDIYRHAVNQLGVRACEAVAFEDSSIGATAARRAGLWVVAVPNPSTEAHGHEDAHWVLESLAGMTVMKLRERFFA